MSGINQMFSDFEIQRARRRVADLQSRVNTLEKSLAGHLAIQTAALENLRKYEPDHSLLVSNEYRQSLVKYGQDIFARSRNWDEIRSDVATLIHI